VRIGINVAQGKSNGGLMKTGSANVEEIVD
jgi:hypothetical protein